MEFKNNFSYVHSIIYFCYLECSEKKNLLYT